MTDNVKRTITDWVEPEVAPTAKELINSRIDELKLKIIEETATPDEIEELKLLAL